MAQLLAYAVVRHDPPEVLAAEDLDVLHWVLALELVAQTRASSLTVDQRRSLRLALLEERWADAVGEWIDITGVPVDVYTDLRVLGIDDVRAETAALELQFSPLFVD